MYTRIFLISACLRAFAYSYDVCDFSHIYNPSQFEYILPEKILKTYYDGNSFDRPTLFYSSEEKERLNEDIRSIFKKVIQSATEQNQNPPLAVFTAGGPGAGKTWLMRSDLKKQASLGKIFPYNDPDDVCLKNMDRTWKQTIDTEVKNSDLSLDKLKEIRKNAYNYWRPASNAATHLILANLIQDRYSFYFGTTSSSPQTGKQFQFLKNLGYRIRLLHITAPDDVRWQSIVKRDQHFVQTTESDTKTKGELVPQRILDTYLKYADEIEFYYRNNVDESAILAATWIRTDEGKLCIHHPAAYSKMINIHNEICQRIQRSDLLWEIAIGQ